MPGAGHKVLGEDVSKHLMKQKTKNIIGIVLGLFLIIEFLIYNSELNFIDSYTFKIIIVNIIIFTAFIFWFFNSNLHKILLTLTVIGIGICFLFWEFMITGFVSERISNSWRIDDYEIIYANQEYYAGKGSDRYLKLREKYFFGLFYKDIDETRTNVHFLKLGTEECYVEFFKTKTEFDLCDKKQLK